MNHILHIDMDAFFAAVEQLDHPEWRGKPVVVGSSPFHRGVVSTASYEARRYGIHSAMPSREAYRRCPHAIFVPGDHQRYHQVSQEVMGILESVSPILEQVSIDEAYLELQGVRGIAQEPIQAAEYIRSQIRKKIGLTASVGVASNMLLAKIASDIRKPDGLTVVPESPQAIAEFLAPLAAGKIYGIGNTAAEVLHRHGIRTVGDLQRATPIFLERLFGANGARRMRELAFGVDQRQVNPHATPAQSISQEHTYEEDCTNPTQVLETLGELVAKVGQRLRQRGLFAGCLTIKVRYGDFSTITRQQPLQPPGDTHRRLCQGATALLEGTGFMAAPRPIRLIGFGVSRLTPPDSTPTLHQPSLFEEENRQYQEQQRQHARDQRLDRVVDELRSRYGNAAVKRTIAPPGNCNPNQ